MKSAFLYAWHAYIYIQEHESKYETLFYAFTFFLTYFELFRIYFRSGTEEETGSSSSP
jgi:low temperature requirement protein LtrA